MLNGLPTAASSKNLVMYMITFSLKGDTLSIDEEYPYLTGRRNLCVSLAEALMEEKMDFIFKR